MSFAGRGLDSYRQTQAQSRTPLELVVMLYDGALRFLAVARDAIERRDIPARREALSRAIAIVSELQSTLKIEEGGELAQSLDSLYGYANQKLLEAAAHNDVKAIDEVRRVFEILRDAWSNIATPATAAAARLGSGQGTQP
jgi:flagellar protein FliS